MVLYKGPAFTRIALIHFCLNTGTAYLFVEI